MLNFSTEIILSCFVKIKDITLMVSIIAKKANTDIPKLAIPNYIQY